MGVSKPKIADRLNLMGIATPGQREKMGNLNSSTGKEQNGVRTSVR